MTRCLAAEVAPFGIARQCHRTRSYHATSPKSLPKNGIPSYRRKSTAPTGILRQKTLPKSSQLIIQHFIHHWRNYPSRLWQTHSEVFKRLTYKVTRPPSTSATGTVFLTTKASANTFMVTTDASKSTSKPTKPDYRGMVADFSDIKDDRQNMD